MSFRKRYIGARLEACGWQDYANELTLALRGARIYLGSNLKKDYIPLNRGFLWASKASIPSLKSSVLQQLAKLLASV